MQYLSTILEKPFINIKASYLFWTKVVCANAVLVVLAKISVPFYPVSMTLGTLGFMLVGTFCSRKVAIAASVGWMLELLVGIPVFSVAIAGPAAYLSTIGGFAFGFMAITLISSSNIKLVENKVFNQLLLLISAEIAMFTLGVAYLGMAHIGLTNAVIYGLYPFILGDICKVLLVIVSYKIYIKSNK